MYGHSRQSLRRLLGVVAGAALIAACSDLTTTSPNRQRTLTASLAAARTPDLATCDSLAAPEGSMLAFHAYAEGVQIYSWSGTSWTFIAPDAKLFADAGRNGKVGTHYAGPTWESVSGSKVVAAVVRRCPATAANSIPWLLLGATSAEGPGIFGDVTYIQRLNTVGGNAPAVPGAKIGEEARVPYTAEYFFYR